MVVASAEPRSYRASDPCVGTLPELASLGVGTLLGRLESILIGLPRGTDAGPGRHWVLRGDVGAIEGLRVGRQRLGAEAQRLSLVVGKVGIVRRAAGVHGQDGDRLAQLTETRDEATTRQGDVIWMGGNEDVGHRGRE
jgi:hypothetical protein